MFKILSFIMKAAPLGAFGAMAFAVGKYGVSSLTSMGGLIALFYVTSILFVVVVLGSVMALPEAEHLHDDPAPQRGIHAHPGHVHRRTGPARTDAQA